MFIVTLEDHPDGVYSVFDQDEDRFIPIFEEEDDANRYAMMLGVDEEPAEMDVVEVDGALAIRTCRLYNYKYAVITPNDIVIPPKLNDNLSQD